MALAWKPTPHQLAVWRATAGERVEPPLVSLKVALPEGSGSCRLDVSAEVWSGGAQTAVSNPPTAALGARGIWRGIPYQEVLIRPVLEDSLGGQPHVLRWLNGTLIIDNNELRSGCESAAGEPSPEAVLFENPQDFAVNPHEPPAATFKIRAAAPPTGLRISLKKDGIYHLSAQYLQERGLDLVGVPAENIHLTCRGMEVPVTITGPKKKKFAGGNGVLFYGQKLVIRDRPVFNGGDYSDTNVYWLYTDDSPGQRMSRTSVAPGTGAPLVGRFTDTVHVEVNSYLAQTFHFRPNGDNWFWAPVLSAPAGSQSPLYEYPVDLPRAEAGEVTVTAVLAGLNEGGHGVRASLNGHPASGGQDPYEWSGIGLATGEWTFSEGVEEGQNTVELVLPGYPSQADLQFLDYLEVSYWRTFEADGGSLRFSGPNGKARYVSRGYSSKPYLLDLSRRDPETGLFLPALLKGAKFASGKATFEMAAAPSPGNRTVALSSAPLLPDSAETATGRDLADPALGADLVILSHPHFHPDGQDAAWQAYLAARRETLEVLAVDIQEVYDQFSHGLMDPAAVRAFLSAAASAWRKPPRFVLLIGDGTYDYKNYKADPTLQNWVPTMMFEDLGDWEYLGRYPSDAWYSDLDADGYPDIPVGRIPARTYDALAGVLDKILAYERQPSAGWNSTILYVADTYSQPWEQEFEAFSDRLQATYTSGPWTNRSVYFHGPPYEGTDADAAAEAIRAAWPSAVVHYTGHSAIGAWGNVEKIFTAYPSRHCSGGTCADSDVDLLPPIGAGHAPLPFVVNATCYVSAFDELGAPSLMEALLARPDGGCVASSGFSTIAYLDEEEAFSEAVFSLLFSAPGSRGVGELMEAGRFALPSVNQRGIMGSILLGDPSLQLKIPMGQLGVRSEEQEVRSKK